MNKILNILTYFIRCSEVKRNKLDKCFDVNIIDSIAKQQLKFKPPCTICPVEDHRLNSMKREIKPPTLVRATSTVKNLNLIGIEDGSEMDLKATPLDKSEKCEANNKLLSSILKKNVMNDLPKVLAFRDSRMVQQEIRIGNKSMDTGLERTKKDRDFLKKYIKTLNDDNNNIKLTVTTPDSDEARELNETDPIVVSGENLNNEEIKSRLTQYVSPNRKCDNDNFFDHKVEFVLGEDEKLIGFGSIDNKKSVTKNSSQECKNEKWDLCNNASTNLTPEMSRPNKIIQPNFAVNLDSRENNDILSVIELPLLECVLTNQEDEMKPGFTLSLFPLTCDHYIADMLLQGIMTTPGNEWEQALKRDIVIASKTETVEHFVIIANLDKFEVRVASSATSSFPTGNSNGIGIVGMSNLIAVMLETVQSLQLSGASEFQCLSLIENKFREIYQLSEALASFLLEIEFCTLNQLTASLNLSINDIPLLMSIASIHTPAIAKKCGITFR